MNKVFGHIKKLYLEMLPPFVFFLVMFLLLSVSRAVSAGQHVMGVVVFAAAVVGALIAAKVVLIANRLPFLNLYPRKPLIYSILAKTVIFSIGMLLFTVVEEMLRLSRKTGGLGPAWEHLVMNFTWSMFLLREMWQFVLVLFYCAGSELTRVVGREKVREIFFGRK